MCCDQTCLGFLLQEYRTENLRTTKRAYGSQQKPSLEELHSWTRGSEKIREGSPSSSRNTTADVDAERLLVATSNSAGDDTTNHLTTSRIYSCRIMLVLPNMAPAHHGPRPASIPRIFLRHITNALTSLLMLLLKILFTAVAILLVPRIIHIIVQCFDDLHDMLGRRARSPWETQMLWGNGALAAMGILVVSHALLFRLSHNAIMDEDVQQGEKKERSFEMRAWKERSVTWERILGRVIIPMLLVGFLVVLTWKVFWAVGASRLINANTVDLEDDARAKLVWSDH